MSKRGIVTRGQAFGPGGAWVAMRHKGRKPSVRDGGVLRNFISLGQYSVPPQKGASYETASSQTWASWYWPGAISLSVGSYALTFPALKDTKASKAAVQAGSYSFTGEFPSFTLTVPPTPIVSIFVAPYEVPAAPPIIRALYYNSYSVTPLQFFSMTAATGNYSLTGENAALLHGARDNLQSGTYTLTGENETLKATRLLNVQETPYALTGENETLRTGRSLTAQSAAFVLTDEQLKLLKASAGKFQTGFYNLTGENLGLSGGRRSSVQSGSYALTGEQIKALKTNLLKAQMTPYTFTGESLSFAFSGGVAASAAITTAFLLGMGPFAGNAWTQLPTSPAPVTAFTISLLTGFYTLTGENLKLTAARKLNLGDGLYTVTGQNLSLAAGHKVSTQTGFYNLTVENEGLVAKRLTTVFTGFYNFTGESIVLTFSGLTNFAVSLGTGTYALTDENLTLVKTSKAGLQVGTYSLTDEALQTLKGSRLTNTTGAYTLTGEALTLKAGHLVSPQTGFYNFSSALSFRKKSLLNSATGFYTVIGNGLSIVVAIPPIIGHPSLFGTDAGVSLSGIKGTGSLLGVGNAGINLTGGESANTLLGTDAVPGVKGGV